MLSPRKAVTFRITGNCRSYVSAKRVQVRLYQRRRKWSSRGDGRDSSLCYDTLRFDCNLNHPDDCARVDSISLVCEQSAGNYTYSLNVTNYTDPAVHVDNISITQTSGAALIQQNDFPVSLSWGSSAVIQIPISGAPGDDVCFYVTLQRENANGLPLDCCSWPDSLPVCITLPDCAAPKSIQAKVAPNPLAGTFRIQTDEACASRQYAGGV